MTLGQKQKLFAKNIAELIITAYSMGYEITLGDAYRDPRLHGEYGHKIGYGRGWSNHKVRLAIDLNLFKDGEYLTKTSDHKQLGEIWEGMHPENRWGGRFNDGNHYSMFHEGHQ